MSTFDIVQHVACSYEDTPAAEDPEVRARRRRTSRPYQHCTSCGASLRRRRNECAPCKRCGGKVAPGLGPETLRHQAAYRQRKRNANAR